MRHRAKHSINSARRLALANTLSLLMIYVWRHCLMQSLEYLTPRRRHESQSAPESRHQFNPRLTMGAQAKMTGYAQTARKQKTWCKIMLQITEQDMRTRTTIPLEPSSLTITCMLWRALNCNIHCRTVPIQEHPVRYDTWYRSVREGGLFASKSRRWAISILI